MEKENLALRTELASLKVVYKQERDRGMALENRIRIHESSIDVLNNKVSNRERQIDELSRKLRDQQNLLTRKDLEKENEKKKFNSKLAVEVDRRDRLHEMKHAKLQDKIRVKEQKLKLLSNIIQSEDVALRKQRSRSSENLSVLQEKQHDKLLQTQAESIQTAGTPRTGEVYSSPRNIRVCSLFTRFFLI